MMTKPSFRIKLRSTLVAMALMSSSVIAFARDGPAQRTSAMCAQRHLEVVTLIEELGEVPDFAGHRLFEALHSPDLQFTEKFRWSPNQFDVSMELTPDEAILEFRIGFIAPCVCREIDQLSSEPRLK